jgi:hypothetical protein
VQELGNVTPYIVCPGGAWTRADLLHHAMHLAQVCVSAFTALLHYCITALYLRLLRYCVTAHALHLAQVCVSAYCITALLLYI